MIQCKTANADVQDSYVGVANSDRTTALTWGAKDDENLATRPNYMWKAMKKADGTFAFKNLGTGRFMGTPFKEGVKEVDASTPLVSSTKPDTIALRSAKVAGIFNLVLATNAFANTDPNSGKVVYWVEGNGTDNSAFSFVPVDGWDGTSTVDCKSNALQIMTMPFSVYSASSPIYKVLGQKDGFVQLAEYADAAVPAGTPFIIEEAEGFSYMQLIAASTDLDELDAEQFVFDAATQNGLVGAISAVKLPVGRGLLLDGVVKLSDDGDEISAGSGYFKEIPATTADGDKTIQLEGVPTDISNAVIEKNAPVSVYTISGVKVRQNVKVGAATQGLPKGIYIVGGKKVLVK